MVVLTDILLVLASTLSPSMEINISDSEHKSAAIEVDPAGMLGNGFPSQSAGGAGMHAAACFCVFCFAVR